MALFRRKNLSSASSAMVELEPKMSNGQNSRALVNAIEMPSHVRYAVSAIVPAFSIIQPLPDFNTLFVQMMNDRERSGRHRLF
jgi:hypothetical protein